MRAMRDLGMEPPSAPFILAPGEYTLYHEWGHYVDRSWSGNNEQIAFSFRWFSRFYKLAVCPPRTHDNRNLRPTYDEVRPIESLDIRAADAILQWWHTSSELFADLFEDWMRAEKKVSWDQCEPKSLNLSQARYCPLVRIALLPGLEPEDVRAETYALFAAPERSAIDLPPVRPSLFGEDTDVMVDHFSGVLSRARRL